ncbi:hypothetical protein [Tropicimonas sp. S265A]|uniref:hypothetical protein n=1 Tax=Tropicimonas sp. S265A TaxID=3415134 RepID=UPI003C7B464C
MAVTRIIDGVAVEVWHDVASIAELAAREPLEGLTEEYVALMGQPGQVFDGQSFSDPVTAAPSPDLVDIEANRRVGLIMAQEQQLAAVARANQLLRKRIEDGSWTAAEETEADALDAAASAIGAIRVAAEALKTNPVGIPADFTDDSHWP